MSRAEALRRESLFREINDSLRYLNEQSDGSGLEVFICECASNCAHEVELSMADYAAVRDHATRFIVLPGHEDERIERVISSHGLYLVVEKPVVSVGGT